jgi:enolase
MSQDSIIRQVLAREIFDSRGVLTVEVDVITEKGWGRNSAPFGAPGSRGEFEAPAYGSSGIEHASEIILEEIAPRLIGMDAAETELCDRVLKEIDGTANFNRIGGNTSSAVSIAAAKAAAGSLKVPLYRFLNPEARSLSLPLPLGNIIGGGAHASGPTPDMQEHLVLPLGARSFRQAVELNMLVHEETGNILQKRDCNFTGGLDDEHGWAADLNDFEALEVLSNACENVRRKTDARFRLGLDLAADRLWDRSGQRYLYSRENESRDTASQIDFVERLVSTFNLGYVEDAFHSNDYAAFAELRSRVGWHCLVCGDDLLATDESRTREGVKQRSMNSMIIKVNQIGTLSGARSTNDYAQSQALKTIISHRSGETDDDSLAHIGLAWGCSMIKAGVLGGERLAKLNELIRIERDLGDRVSLVVASATIPGETS